MTKHTLLAGFCLILSAFHVSSCGDRRIRPDEITSEKTITGNLIDASIIPQIDLGGYHVSHSGPDRQQAEYVFDARAQKPSNFLGNDFVPANNAITFSESSHTRIVEAAYIYRGNLQGLLSLLNRRVGPYFSISKSYARGNLYSVDILYTSSIIVNASVPGDTCEQSHFHNLLCGPSSGLTCSATKDSYIMRLNARPIVLGESYDVSIKIKDASFINSHTQSDSRACGDRGKIGH